MAKQLLDSSTEEESLDMCGIVGALSFDGKRIDPMSVVSMRDALMHRGPDAEGIWKNDECSVVLGHRRLSIIDLETRSHQPMTDYENGLRIVFNGEIYNYKEIQAELRSDYRFRTSSDTEVVLYAYKKWGLEGALSRFRGFFAFALYDADTQMCYLVRDRFGKKPLYYFIDSSSIWFSSEVHSFRKVRPLKVRTESLYDYLTLGCVIAPDAFLEGVKKVPPGTYLRVSPEGKIAEKTYYDVSKALSLHGENENDISLEKLAEALDESVQYRTVSDVPFALSLSGGLDSSLNAYFCRQKKPLSLTFTWKGENPHAENEVARKVAETFDLPFREIALDPAEFERECDHYISLQKDAPVGDINAVLIYMMAREIRNLGYKVCIVGEGGDEIGGYPTYWNLYRNKALLKGLPVSLLRLIPLPAKVKRLLEYSVGDETVPFHILLGFTESQKRKFWLGDVGDTYGLIARIMSEINTGSNEFDKYLRKVSVLEYKVRLPELILARIDYPSMAASVEMRSPYMDHVLIELFNKIPWGKRMAHGSTKYHFREIARKYLPVEVLNHPKVGFTHVVEPFLRHTLPENFRKNVIEKDSPIKELVSPKFLASVHKILRNEDLWRLYSLNAWLRLVG